MADYPVKECWAVRGRRWKAAKLTHQVVHLPHPEIRPDDPRHPRIAFFPHLARQRACRFAPRFSLAIGRREVFRRCGEIATESEINDPSRIIPQTVGFPSAIKSPLNERLGTSGRMKETACAYFIAQRAGTGQGREQRARCLHPYGGSPGGNSLTGSATVLRAHAIGSRHVRPRGSPVRSWASPGRPLAAVPPPAGVIGRKTPSSGFSWWTPSTTKPAWSRPPIFTSTSTTGLPTIRASQSLPHTNPATTTGMLPAST